MVFASRLSRRQALLGVTTALASSLPVPEQSVAQPLPRLRNGGMLGTPDFTRLAADPFRVGIRPHRETGVRLEIDPEPMYTGRGTKKFLIHNYGHGGAGITLSFGCAEVVRLHVGDLVERELRKPLRQVRVAVVGAGVIGLTVASELKRWRPEVGVRVYARNIGADRRVDVRATTSWVAGGQFEPSGIWREYARPGAPQTIGVLHDYVRRSAARIAELKRRQAQRLYGIVDRNNYTLQDYSRRQMPLMEDAFEIGTPRDVIAAPELGTLPFASLCGVPGREYKTWLINPTILLPRLVSDLRQAGTAFERRDLQTEADPRGLDADIIVNCTGFGAKALMSDMLVKPIRGQLVILQNPRELKYMFSGGCGSSVAYLFARQSDIVVGGTYEVDVEAAVHNETACRLFLARMRDVFAGNIAPCDLVNPAGECGVA